MRERTKDTWGLWRKHVLNPESNVQFGEGGAGTFSDGKLYSQIKDPKHLRAQGADRVRQGRRAGGNSLRVSKPHIGTFRLVGMVENMRARDRGAGRRNSLSSSASTTSLIEDGHRSAAWCWPAARRIAQRPRRAGGRPQRARHLRDAARARRLHGSQAVLHRLSHRASAIADRPRAAGAECRQSAARRGRLQAGAPRQERPLGLQLLHVPRRHGGGGHLRAGPRGHQRHEPVFAQRAQRQRAASWSASRPRIIPARSAGRHRVAAQLEARAFELGGGNYDAPGATGRRFPRRAAFHPARQRSSPPTRRACT